MANKPTSKSKVAEVEEEAEGILSYLEDKAEHTLFASRWLLAPFYFGLTAAVLLLAFKFIQEFFIFASHIFEDDTHAVELGILGLLDLTLIGNLMLIMIFAGYENFVSKIDAAVNSVDRPHWMGRVDYSGLKIKLIGSLVAISVIELLKDFMNLDHSQVNSAIKWRILIHLTFVISGVLFALMDYIVEKRERLDVDIEEVIKRAKLKMITDTND